MLYPISQPWVSLGLVSGAQPRERVGFSFPSKIFKFSLRFLRSHPSLPSCVCHKEGKQKGILTPQRVEGPCVWHGWLHQEVRCSPFRVGSWQSFGSLFHPPFRHLLWGQTSLHESPWRFRWWARMQYANQVCHGEPMTGFRGLPRHLSDLLC